MAATALVAASGLTHAAFISSAAGSGVAGSGAAIDPTQAAHYLAAMMWTAFGSAVASLITSALGGWMGAHHIQRVYHLRQYAEHGRTA